MSHDAQARLEAALPAGITKNWKQYIHEERSGVRREALTLLDTFIKALLQEPPALWKNWALALAVAIVDEGQDIPVRMPLFRQVLLPSLVESVLKETPGAARWLAHFDQLLYHCHPTGLPPHLESKNGLLIEAVRVHGHDKRSLTELVSVEADYFEFTLHELPSGVLYGMNGATPEQCKRLLEAVDEFEQLARQSGKGSDYAELISECRYHYTKYGQYCAQHDKEMSYAEFLNSQE